MGEKKKTNGRKKKTKKNTTKVKVVSRVISFGFVKSNTFKIRKFEKAIYLWSWCNLGLGLDFGLGLGLGLGLDFGLDFGRGLGL